MTITVAVVARDPALGQAVCTEVRTLGHRPIAAASVAEALAAAVHLVFAQWTPGADLAKLLGDLGRAAAAPEGPPVVVVVPPGGLTAMHRARDAGAADVLFCPPDPEEIRAEIEETARAAHPFGVAERARFREIVQKSLVGESAAFKKCLDELRLAAGADANILLVGETGTGKEMFARAAHRISRRSGEPFIAVNCAGLSPNLLESELFGHAKGAFTDAKVARAGRFEVVQAGTLLLDEIGDVPVPLQVKLLRVIEQRVFQRVGENEDVEFHGRLICATSVDLEAAVKDGRFRSDLLGRIDQFRIVLPPLCERRVDIPILLRYFLDKHARGRPVAVSRTAQEIIEAFDFPMNVRQLENAVVEALARLGGGSIILPHHLPKDVTGAKPAQPCPEAMIVTVPRELPYEEARAHACRAVDHVYLTALLEKHGGNQSRAAEEAGIDRKTFAARLRSTPEGGEEAADG